MRIRAALVLAVAALVVGACGGSEAAGDPRAVPRRCGIPQWKPQNNADLVPRVFLLDGAAAVLKAYGQDGRLNATLVAALNLRDAFQAYQDVLPDEGYRILLKENEVTEADLLVKDEHGVGSVQVIRSKCEEATLVILNIGIEQKGKKS